MNKFAMTIAGVMLCAGSACASNAAGGRELFRHIDTNGDRMLEFTEIEAARASLFDRMDTNHDSKISRNEFADFIPDRLLQADTNGDRSLSLSELRALRRQ